MAIDGTERGAFRAAFKARLGTADAIMLRVGPADGDAEIVVITHEVCEANFRQALAAIEALADVQAVAACLRTL